MIDHLWSAIGSVQHSLTAIKRLQYCKLTPNALYGVTKFVTSKTFVIWPQQYVMTFDCKPPICYFKNIVTPGHS